jgi:hypothetical protein
MAALPSFLRQSADERLKRRACLWCTQILVYAQILVYTQRFDESPNYHAPRAMCTAIGDEGWIDERSTPRRAVFKLLEAASSVVLSPRPRTPERPS